MTCYRCDEPIPERATGGLEGPWELRDGSGKWICMPCVTELVNDAEVAETNRALDDAMSKHLAHERLGTFAGCPLCAIGV